MMAYLKNLTFGKLRGILDGIRGHIAKQSTILDRLLHHSAVINIKGSSYRLKEKIQLKEDQ